MIKNNQKCKYSLPEGYDYKKQDQGISDFDAVSLYPSAQKRLWYPTGNCLTLSQEQIKYYNQHENLMKITEA